MSSVPLPTPEAPDAARPAAPARSSSAAAPARPDAGSDAVSAASAEAVRRGDHRPVAGILYKIASSSSFAGMAASAKAGARELESPAVVFARSTVMILVLLPWMLARRVPLLGANHLFLHLRCLFGVVALHLNYFALQSQPLAETVVLSSTAPLFVPALARLVLGERPRRILLLLQLVGFSGVVTMAAPRLGGLDPGLLAALGAGFFIALGVVCLKRVTTREAPTTIVFTFALWSLASSAAWAPALLSEEALAAALPLLLVGLFALGGQVLLTRALACAPAGVVASLNYVGVVISFGLGLAFFGEVPGLRTLVGAALVVGSCAATGRLAAGSRLITYASRRRRPTEEEEEERAVEDGARSPR